jgi:hypothetical protein
MEMSCAPWPRWVLCESRTCCATDSSHIAVKVVVWCPPRWNTLRFGREVLGPPWCALYGAGWDLVKSRRCRPGR